MRGPSARTGLSFRTSALMPSLDEAQIAFLRDPPSEECELCLRQIKRNNRRQCDEYFYDGREEQLRPPANPYMREDHRGHRTYEQQVTGVVSRVSTAGASTRLMRRSRLTVTLFE